MPLRPKFERISAITMHDRSSEHVVYFPYPLEPIRYICDW